MLHSLDSKTVNQLAEKYKEVSVNGKEVFSRNFGKLLQRRLRRFLFFGCYQEECGWTGSGLLNPSALLLYSFVVNLFEVG